ncbi:ATP-grasp domain-containing protein [Pseudomonas sp. REP124]|uniref:ATP-grasp domain-containing protein n=1 Tax=Pseudomonas sp. REP124 TaxID=2875731 RepID=UPI001CCF0DDC|nr:ATP-grasp domain-containing protein [Pseudomonas sp. REP124]MBZ9780188.1 ATP-grasp domain-containing protein [Pseudomonas sp. REP124]
MKPEILIFIDNDYLSTSLYLYRRWHFQVAAKENIRCITIIAKDSRNISEASDESDEVVLVDSIEASEVLYAVEQLSRAYIVKGLFCYPAHVTPHGDANNVVEYIARQYGLNYYGAESLENCNNKYLMRSQLSSIKDGGLVSFRLFSGDFETINGIKYPVVMKPVYGGGSAFVSICDDLKSLEKAYSHFIEKFPDVPGAYSFSGTEKWLSSPEDGPVLYLPGVSVLIEEFIEGPEGSLECLVVDGNIYPMLIFEKMITRSTSNTVLEKVIVTPPQSFSTDQISKIVSTIGNSIKALKVKNGFLHVEFKLSKNGPQVIEVNPRLGGFFVDDALKDLCSCDAYALNVNYITGKPVTIGHHLADALPILPEEAVYAMLLFYPARSGYIKAIKIPEIDSACEILSQVQPTTNGHKDGFFDVENEEAYIAKMWVRAKSIGEILRVHEEYERSIKVEIYECREDKLLEQC